MNFFPDFSFWISSLIPQQALIFWLAPFLQGYMFGSIPFAFLLTHWSGKGDIRHIGSGNVGATNVLRTGRKDIAVATLLLDGLKGTLAVLFAPYICTYLRGTSDLLNLDLGSLLSISLWAASGAFLGHLYPIWLNFKGGKGVATFLGCLFSLYWPAALSFICVWGLTFFLFSYSSLASLLASVFASFTLAIVYPPSASIVFFCLSLLLWFRHRSNIQRLLNGTEKKITKQDPSR